MTPTVQVFATRGTVDAAYWGPPTGDPGDNGIIAEIAYVPFGKPDSAIAWGNIRLAAQYVSYFRLDGQARGAPASNTLYFSVWAAAHF